MEEVKRFRKWVVRVCLTVTLLLGVGSCLVSVKMAQGVLLGGFASTLGFWFSAKTFETLDIAGERNVKYRIMLNALLRLTMYGVVLYKAYTLDVVHLLGFWGAAAGLFVIRIGVTVAGFTNWDQERAGQ